MDVRSLHVPRCLLGEDAGPACDPGADGVMVVTPEASFERASSRLPSGSLTSDQGTRFTQDEMSKNMNASAFS